MKVLYPFIVSSAICMATPHNAQLPNPSSEEIGKSKMRVIEFGLTFKEFFLTPNKNSPAVGEILIDQGFTGLVIDGPRYIPIDKESEFPVAAISVAESMQSSRYLFDEFCLATALDLHSGHLYTEYFIEPKFVRSDSKRFEALAKNPPPPGLTSDGGAADLFARLRIPKRTGEYLVTAILLGKASNQMRVKVGFSDAEHDPAKFKLALRNTPKDPGIITEIPLVEILNQIKTPASPPLPAENGIVLHTEVLDGSKEDAEVVIFGSYRLPNPKRNGDKSITFTLLGTSTETVLPLLQKVKLNPPNTPSSEGSETVEGFFSLKVDSEDGLRGNQTYFFYALSEQALSAPSKVELVSSMKPKPE